MTTLRHQYPLALLCRVLEVSRSGYYVWQHRRSSTRAQENARLEVAIQAAHVRTRQMYGPEPLQVELCADGFPAGIGRITGGMPRGSRPDARSRSISSCSIIGIDEILD